MLVTVHSRLGRRRAVCAHATRVAVRQVEGKKVRLLLHPADDHPRLAKVRLRVSRRMRQRHEHLPAPAPAAVLTHVVLHNPDRVKTLGAGDSVRRMAMLGLAMRHILGIDRSQVLLLPEAVDDYVGRDSPVRFIDAFVDGLDLAGAGFERAAPKATGRPGYGPADLLKLYIYGISIEHVRAACWRLRASVISK